MNYIIYGVNRVAKDFIYIFDKLDILYFVDESTERDTFLNLPVYKIDEALQKRDFDKIIICDFDKTKALEVMERYGFSYNVDYVFEEDFFSLLDDFGVPDSTQILVWGTGKSATEFMDWNDKYCNYKIEGFIDNDAQKVSFRGKTVYHPTEISDLENYFIIIAVAKDAEIVTQLKDMGLIVLKNFVNYQKVITRPSELLRRTIFDDACYDLECHTMLNHLEVLIQGNTRCCCTTFVHESIGNVLEMDNQSLWHSILHKIMCLSTENKTYSFCDKSMCPLFVNKFRKQSESVCDDLDYKKMTMYPEVLALGYDSSCNLSCATCRKKIHVATGEEKDTNLNIAKKVLDEYLENSKFLILAGNGEVFSTDAYRQIYKSEKCNQRYIRLLTNGTLFTKDNWDCFIKNKTAEVMLTVSIDAATKETYESIRRNGNFEKLKENMKFAAELRKRKELRYFRLNFVVQKNNYKEMIEFVKWGEELGVDEIFFTKILNWGTYSQEEFKEVSMMEEDGVTPKKELMNVLENPIIKNSRIVDLGTIQYGHKKDKVDIVDNYYKWELEKRGGIIFDI